MIIPLWLPWAVVVALALPALLGLAGRESDDGPRGLRRAQAWAPTAVALAVAVALSVDQARVSQDELFEAAEGAAQGLDGSLGGVTQDRLQVAVEDRLGRDVTVERTEGTAEESALEATYSFEVRLDDEGSPAACVEATQSTAGGQPIAWTTLSARHGGCS